jgi:hypothetical protein
MPLAGGIDRGKIRGNPNTQILCSSGTDIGVSRTVTLAAVVTVTHVHVQQLRLLASCSVNAVCLHLHLSSRLKLYRTITCSSEEDVVQFHGGSEISAAGVGQRPQIFCLVSATV